MFNLKAPPIITNVPFIRSSLNNVYFRRFGDHLFVERIRNDFSNRMFHLPVLKNSFDVQIKRSHFRSFQTGSCELLHTSGRLQADRQSLRVLQYFGRTLGN